MPRTLGDFHTLGADCDSTGRSEVAEIGRRIARDCESSGDAAGRPPACSDAQEVSRVLNVVADVVNVVARGVQAYGQQQFQNTVRRGQDQMVEGQRQMAENGQQMNDAVGDWLTSSSNFNTLNQQLADIAGTVGQTRTAIQGYDAQLNTLNQQLSASIQAVTDAESSLARAQDRNNYPRTFEGLTQQKANTRAATAALRDAQLSQAAVEDQQATVVNARNDAVAVNNQAVSQAQATEAQLAGTRADAQAAQARANQAQAGVRQGQQTYGSGVATIREGMRDFQEIRQGVTASVETSNGLRGAGRMVEQIDRERYYSAGAVPFSEGYGAYARQSGNAAMVNATTLVSSGINSIASALDRGGDAGQVVENIVADFGQATLRTGDMANIADQVEVADCIMNNPNNPNRVYDGLSHLNSQIAPVFDVAGGIAQTASPFFPGGQSVSPLIPYVANGLGTFATGVFQTAIEAANTAWRQGGVSTQVTNSPQRTGPGGLPVGRPGSLFDRAAGGEASAGTVMMAGVVTTLGGVSASIVNTAMNAPNNSARVQGTIQQIARTSLPPSQPIRAGDVTLRPIAGD